MNENGKNSPKTQNNVFKIAFGSKVPSVSTTQINQTQNNTSSLKSAKVILIKKYLKKFNYNHINNLSLIHRWIKVIYMNLILKVKYYNFSLLNKNSKSYNSHI